jgi:hypothetical protein
MDEKLMRGLEWTKIIGAKNSESGRPSTVQDTTKPLNQRMSDLD